MKKTFYTFSALICAMFFLQMTAGKSASKISVANIAFLEGWKNLPKFAQATPDKIYRELNTWLPDRGLRGLYAKVNSTMGVRELERISGVKVFLDGPHSNGALNLRAHHDFGHYNPAFVKWLKENAIPGRQNPLVRKQLQPVYSKFIRRTARAYHAAYRLLHSDKERLARIRGGYERRIKMRENPGEWLQESFRADSDNLERRGLDWYETNTAFGFWVRRSIDKTDREFFKILEVLIHTYDAEFSLKSG